MPPPPSVAWAPAKLAASPTRCAEPPRELLELAKQLELVERQRQQLLRRRTSSPPASPSHQRRPPSPATALLAPLSLATSPSPPLGLAPPLAVSDVAVCDMCAAELASASRLRAHKAASCPLRVVVCPRAGCGESFAAQDRLAHDRDACPAVKRTQQLLEDHKLAHALLPCPRCQEPTETRSLEDHMLFACVKREVSCQFEPFGCHDTFPFDERETHEATTCRVARHRAKVRALAATVNERIACDWCGQQVLKRGLLDHQEEECPKRERPCPNADNGCDEWVPVDEVAAHLKSQCVVTRERDAMAARAREMNTTVVCTECGADVTRRYLQAHAARECVSRVVACKNAAHGCKARLRWRDRHLHEDFLALASRARSMLEFPVGGKAYVVLQSETAAQLERRSVDLAPPWTLEVFLWLADARDEILDLHARAIEFTETLVARQREHERFTQQAKACKKKLAQLKHLRKTDKDARSNSQVLGDVALAAKQLADEFNAADAGVVDTAQAIALARGHIQILVLDAHKLLCEERARDPEAATQIQRLVETQALDAMATRELLGGECLSEDEQLRLGDLDAWAAALTPSSASATPAAMAARQQRLAEQRKLLDKRATLQQSLAELDAPDVDPQEAFRLRRRHERELAKVDAKLALVSDSTPPVLLDRKGRHVLVSSARNAIVLAGATHGRLAYFRGGSGSGSSTNKRGEIDLQVSLPRNRWHHVAFCASAREMTVIVNGDAKAVKRGVFELPFARLGSNEPDGVSLQGFVQEVRVWRSCLSRDYLRANATRIVDVPRHNGDLVAYYTLEEGAGELVDDMALTQPRAACLGTTWVLYNTAAIRQKFGLPPTPSLRDKTSCVVNQRLKLLAQRAQDRATEPQACRQGCGVALPLRELDAHHRSECPNRLVVCHEAGCEATFRSCDRTRHLQGECQRHAYREELVRQREERETREPCLLRCGEQVPRRHAERHYTGECPHRLVACECGESIVAKRMARHVDVDCRSAQRVAQRAMVANARKRQQDKLMEKPEGKK